MAFLSTKKIAYLKEFENELLTLKDVYNFTTLYKIDRKNLSGYGKKPDLVFSVPMFRQALELRKNGYNAKQIRIVLHDPLYKSIISKLDLSLNALKELAHSKDEKAFNISCSFCIVL